MMARLKMELIIGGILLIALISLFLMWKGERRERMRTETNQNALLQEVTRFKTKDSLNVLQNETLTLTNREFKKYNGELVETVKSLNLTVRRLQSASSTAVTTVTPVNAAIKDSIVYRDRDRLIKDTLKCIDFSDGWVSAEGCVDYGKFSGTIISRDTIQTFADRIPRFLWFGTKAIRQTIVAKNPHSIIEYNKVINLKRRK